ncbi:MAG TPA: Maf family protein [Candidatus Saccharimonadales bacterium]|nr:Maf family protein [Candidatus Saccharimonadales bacterium]
MIPTETRLILASQSSRRKELLNGMGLENQYKIIPSNYEEVLDNARSPKEVAQELGYGKALWVAKRNPGAWVIGSDTIVTIDGKQLGKAADLAEARKMLKMLAGMTSTVTTSVVLVRMTQGDNNSDIIKHYIGCEEVTVNFKPYDKADMEAYLATGDWQDKAGAYGIQSGAHQLIDSIEGNYDTIIGLPTHTLADFLAQIGVQAKPVSLVAPVPQKPRPIHL